MSIASNQRRRDYTWRLLSTEWGQNWLVLSMDLKENSRDSFRTVGRQVLSDKCDEKLVWFETNIFKDAERRRIEVKVSRCVNSWPAPAMQTH